jgi:hypothetical protein
MSELPEYLYGDSLRWNFGFENPNKAAVLFACLLPLCWLAWSASWRIGRLWLRIPAIVFSGLLFLGAGGCLLSTFSRGGLVAGLVAMGYLWFQSFLRLKVVRSEGDGGDEGDEGKGETTSFWQSPSFWFSLLLILLLICGAIWCGLAERASSGVVGDASVTHRLELWKGALQMAHDNPLGFGAGQSGTAYMDWYQALERTEGYRTMVNSYLTFLVERGWALFGLSLTLAVLFWRWSLPHGKHCQLIISLKASILAFLVAGFFSTTMENPWLWILPSLAAFAVVAMMFATKETPRWGVVLRDSITITLLLLGGLWMLGWWMASKDPLIRECGHRDGLRTVVSVSPRNPAHSIHLIPDPIVLGDRYGKLIQALALGANSRVGLEGGGKSDLLLATGVECFKKASDERQQVIWIAPPVPSESEAANLARFAHPALLLNPEIDEDGRSSWWIAHPLPHTQIIPLDGVGTRIDWAWDRIIEIIKKPADGI